MTLSDLKGHLPIARLFTWDFSYSFAANWQDVSWQRIARSLCDSRALVGFVYTVCKIPIMGQILPLCWASNN